MITNEVIIQYINDKCPEHTNIKIYKYDHMFRYTYLINTNEKSHNEMQKSHMLNSRVIRISEVQEWLSFKRDELINKVLNIK